MSKNSPVPAPFNRHTGLLIVEVRMSNPNGDPDIESDPRTLESDGRGLISPVSVKRKVRDLVLRNGDVMRLAREKLSLESDGDSNLYEILEARDIKIKDIRDLGPDAYRRRFWDARFCGNMDLEAYKHAENKKKGSGEHFIATGVVQVGPGISISRVNIVRLTQTAIRQKEEATEGKKEKSRGMAPLSFRVVEHGLYAIPFFVNPELARRTGATANDLSLFKFLLPKAYPLTASASRMQVFPIHCWCAEHNSPWGSCPDPFILDALMPKRKGDDPFKASTALSDYEIPLSLPDRVQLRLKPLKDLCEA